MQSHLLVTAFVGAGKYSKIIPKIAAARREIPGLRRFGTFFLVLWRFVALGSARKSPRQQIPDIVARCAAEGAGLEGLPFSTLYLLRRRRLPTRPRAEIGYAALCYTQSPARHRRRSIAHPLWEGLFLAFAALAGTNILRFPGFCCNLRIYFRR